MSIHDSSWQCFNNEIIIICLLVSRFPPFMTKVYCPCILRFIIKYVWCFSFNISTNNNSRNNEMKTKANREQVFGDRQAKKVLKLSSLQKLFKNNLI